MYRGNPHQDRNPFKSFTGGFQQGWQDRKGRLNTGVNESIHGPLNPSGIQLAELTQKQMDMMGSHYNTPAFGVSKEDLWNRTKGMEDKGSWWNPFDSGQESTTPQEFNDYYNKLSQGEEGNWLAMAGEKKRINSTIPIGPTLTPGYNSIWDMQEEDFKNNIMRNNTGYRYNKYGIVPLNFNAYS